MVDTIAGIMLFIGAMAIIYYSLSAFIEYKIFEETKFLEKKVNKMWDEVYNQRQEIDNLAVGCSIDRAVLKDIDSQIFKIKDKLEIHDSIINKKKNRKDNKPCRQ